MSTIARTSALVLLCSSILVTTDTVAVEGFVSAGGTQVSVTDPPIVDITVYIDFGVADPNAEGLRAELDEIARSIAVFWNDRWPSGCLIFNLAVKIDVVTESAIQELPVNGISALVTRPGRHLVIWGGSRPNAPWPKTYDPYDPDQIATPGEDYTSPYAHELWAQWSGHLVNERDFAHEFGHLLGLGDDYLDNGLPIPGREGTLMDNGDEIDDVLAGRLAGVIEKSGQPLPQCWKGTISGAIQTPGCDPVSQTGELSLTVNKDRSVVGRGTTVSGAYGCDNGASVPEGSIDYELTGQMTDRFTLTFADGVELTSTPIEEGRATLTQDTGFGVVTIELNCDGCR